MGNDPSRPLMELIGEFDPNHWSEHTVWQCMHIAEKEAVLKLLSHQQNFTMTQMMNGSVAAADLSELLSPSSSPDILSPKPSSPLVTLWKLNRHHKVVNGDKGLANLACWIATAGNRERSKWMHPSCTMPLLQNKKSSSSSSAIGFSFEQDLLALPGRNCHVIRFYRGEPYEAFQKFVGIDLELGPSGAIVSENDSSSAVVNTTNKQVNSTDAGKIDLFLTSPGLYAPLLQYHSKSCESSTKFARCAISPPTQPSIASMSASELLLGLVDIAYGLAYLHQDNPLSPATKCAHNNICWASIFVRSDANGNRLPWVLFDPRYTRIEHQNGIQNAFVRTQLEREFGAPEIVRSEYNDDFLCSGDVYSFGKLVDSILMTGSEFPSSSAGSSASSSAATSTTTVDQKDSTVVSARKELEKFVAKCLQAGDLNRRPNISQFMELSCVRNSAFVRLMRLIDYFFPWHLDGAEIERLRVEEELYDEEETILQAARRQERKNKNKNKNNTETDDRQQQQEDDDDDDIESFALDLAFGVSPRQLPTSILVRVKALFFSSLHIECMKIPNELFMRRVVPRLLDHQVFCSGAASPFLWQLLTPISSSGSDVIYPLPTSSSSSLLLNVMSQQESSSKREEQDHGAVQFPTVGLLQPNDLRNVLKAFVLSQNNDASSSSTTNFLPSFTIESDDLRSEYFQQQQQSSATLSTSSTTMFLLRENAAMSARIAQTRHKHKVIFILRAIDVFVTQLLSLDLLAKLLVPFVVSCLHSQTEFVVRAAIMALKSILNLCYERQKTRSDSNSKSKKKNKRKSQQQQEDDEEDVTIDVFDEDETDERWQFIIGLACRSLLMCADLTLNDTAQLDTRSACYNACRFALDEFASSSSSFRTRYLIPKLIVVSQKLLSSSSASTPSELKMMSLEFLYDFFNTSREVRNNRGKIVFAAELAPFCLCAAQNSSNSDDVRSLASKILCILLNWCEKQNKIAENENENNDEENENDGGEKKQQQQTQIPPSFHTVCDRWDAASFNNNNNNSSISSCGLFYGSSSSPKAFGKNFKSPTVILSSLYSTRAHKVCKNANSSSSSSSSTTIRIISQTTMPPRGCALRRIAVVYPPLLRFDNNNENSKTPSLIIPSWIAHDIDFKINAANVLSARPPTTSNSSSSSSIPPQRSTPTLASLVMNINHDNGSSSNSVITPPSIRGHPSSSKLPSRLVLVRSTSSNENDNNNTDNNKMTSFVVTTLEEQQQQKLKQKMMLTTSPTGGGSGGADGIGIGATTMTSGSNNDATSGATILSGATARRNRRKQQLQQEKEKLQQQQQQQQHQKNDDNEKQQQPKENNNNKEDVASPTTTTTGGGGGGGVLRRKRLAVAEAESEAAIAIAQKQQEEKEEKEKEKQKEQQEKMKREEQQQKQQELHRDPELRDGAILISNNNNTNSDSPNNGGENINQSTFSSSSPTQDQPLASGNKQQTQQQSKSAVPKRRRIGGGGGSIIENNIGSTSQQHQQESPPLTASAIHQHQQQFFGINNNSTSPQQQDDVDDDGDDVDLDAAMDDL